MSSYFSSNAVASAYDSHSRTSVVAWCSSMKEKSSLMASPRRRVASGIIILDSSTTSSIFFTSYSSLVGSARMASTRASSFLVSAS